MKTLKKSVRLSSDHQVLVQYHVLLEAERLNINKMGKLLEELVKSYKTFDFSILNETLTSRLVKLVLQYGKYQRKPTEKFKKSLRRIFHLTELDGEWLRSECSKKNWKQGYQTRLI